VLPLQFPVLLLFLHLFSVTVLFSAHFSNQEQKTVKKNTDFIGERVHEQEQFLVLHVHKGTSNTIVLLLNIWNQGTWNRFFLQLKCFLDVTIFFDNHYKLFYTNMCTQSSENHLFPLPEKEDS
jgi:hypothetical protein